MSVSWSVAGVRHPISLNCITIADHYRKAQLEGLLKDADYPNLPIIRIG